MATEDASTRTAQGKRLTPSAECGKAIPVSIALVRVCCCREARRGFRARTTLAVIV
jgi:hypothetical protein